MRFPLCGTVFLDVGLMYLIIATPKSVRIGNSIY